MNQRLEEFPRTAAAALNMLRYSVVEIEESSMSREQAVREINTFTLRFAPAFMPILQSGNVEVTFIEPMPMELEGCLVDDDVEHCIGVVEGVWVSDPETGTTNTDVSVALATYESGYMHTMKFDLDIIARVRDNGAVTAAAN